jgi:predicted dehydrogenase
MRIHAVVCGLRFGGAFVPIWKDHPMVETVGVFDTDPQVLKETADHFGIEKRYAGFDAVLSDTDVDAVHLVSPIPCHEEQSVQVLKSGKHCACTVPMATSLEGLRRIVDAKRESGKIFMMMETTLYTRQFAFVQKMIRDGELGRVQFLRGSHYQDMENWPEYWMGLPPMHYGTHAIAPLAAIAGARIKTVYALGSGTMREELTRCYGNPFPVETALFTFENGMKAEATRSLFETAHVYQEGLNVYGSNATFEWGFRDEDNPIITKLIKRDNIRGFDTPCQTLAMPPFFGALPEKLFQHTLNAGEYDPTSPEKALTKGAAAGHHGSHPHMVHEFVSSILENRKPWTNEVMAANITAAGICAHLSALEGGKVIEIPAF